MVGFRDRKRLCIEYYAKDYFLWKYLFKKMKRMKDAHNLDEFR